MSQTRPLGSWLIGAESACDAAIVRVYDRRKAPQDSDGRVDKHIVSMEGCVSITRTMAGSRVGLEAQHVLILQCPPGKGAYRDPAPSLDGLTPALMAGCGGLSPLTRVRYLRGQAA